MRYASLRQGLVGAWCPSLGATGYRLLDRSGYGNHGTLTNMDAGTDWVGGPYGTALDFDGVNDAVIMQNKGTVTGTSPFTLSAWAVLKTLPNFYRGALMIGGGVVGESAYIGWVSGAQIGTNNSWGGGGFGRNYGSGVTEFNKWTHVALTSSGGASQTFIIYVNAERKTTGTESITLTNVHLRIGSNSSDAFLNGQIDDARLYNRALNPIEIRLLASEPGIGLKPERVSVYFGESLSSRRRKILTGLT